MKKAARIAFIPTEDSRRYFEALVKRLSDQNHLGVRVTKREAFDHMVRLAIEGEISLGERFPPEKIIPERLLRRSNG